MFSRYLPLIPAALLMLTGCSPKSSDKEAKPTTIPLVSETERSQHFDAVSQQLELGGTMFAYVDVDGDSSKIAANLTQLLDTITKAQPMAAMVTGGVLQVGVDRIFQELGINDIKAVGLSSVPDSKNAGFRNRVFLYTPNGRRGLMAMGGDQAAAFDNLQLAPEDADCFWETDLDAGAVYGAVTELAKAWGGDGMVEGINAQLSQPNPDLGGTTPLDLIKAIKGRFTFILKVRDEMMSVPDEPKSQIPVVDFLIQSDNAGELVAGVLEKQAGLQAEMNADGEKVFRIPGTLPEYPILGTVKDSKIVIASSQRFLDECRHRQGASLKDQPELKELLDELGGKGNGITYLSPGLFKAIHSVFESAQASVPNNEVQAQQGLDLMLNYIPMPEHELVSIRQNLPNGVLYRSHWDRSLKKEFMLATTNPLGVGLLAAMAIPAFQKVRVASQDKAIQNNLRQLSSAAHQYFLETGEHVATYEKLVGPNLYIRRLDTVAGEDYSGLIIHDSDTEITVWTGNGRAISVPR